MFSLDGFAQWYQARSFLRDVAPTIDKRSLQFIYSMCEYLLIKFKWCPGATLLSKGDP